MGLAIASGVGLKYIDTQPLPNLEVLKKLTNLEVWAELSGE